MSIESNPKEGLQTVSSFMQGLQYLSMNSPELALTEFQEAKKGTSDDAVSGILDYFIEVCNIIKSSSTLSYIEAFVHIGKAKLRIDGLKGKLPPQLNNMVEAFTKITEIILLEVSGQQSTNNLDYDVASEKFQEVAEKIGEMLKLAIFTDDSTIKYFEGLQELYYGMSKFESAQFQSESGLSENAINLCQEASQNLMRAAEKFIFSVHPMAEGGNKSCLEMANTIIPKHISNYKIRSLKEEAYRKALSEIDRYKQIIEKMIGMPATNISFENANQLIQENVTIVNNVEKELKISLEELLKLDSNNDVDLSDLKKSITPLLREKGKSFLDNIKALRPKLEAVGKVVEKTTPIFITLGKILEYLKLIP